ncbi:alpha/beta fold hydrolase [Aeromicrobium terrae]|uniref:Alpha/beta fold hydrolase n=2 Tax=Aeromicrobium terrae TaxID=2498846 RepID=A0A5C8NK11_9ACTN|nr:alpha/beta fold hydrolase [Aeromicrobium terrae]
MLLVMGLGGPMGWWATELCEKLAARGFLVIRYDNRDTGRSTKLSQHRVTRTDIVRAFLLPGRSRPPYTLDDLADDAVGLLDHLGIDRAHVVGVSMGGMIGQILAIDHADRVLSFTSIMSTTGRRTVGRAHPKLFRAILSSAGPNRDTYTERAVRTAELIGSPAYPPERDASVARAHETYDRGWSASGVARQTLAVLTQTDRTERLADVKVPVTVIHGTKDLLVNSSGGRATARAIRGAKHLEIPGMGHDLPPALYDTFVDAIVATAERAVDR